MRQDADIEGMHLLRVDGGATKSDLLMQIQVSTCGRACAFSVQICSGGTFVHARVCTYLMLLWFRLLSETLPNLQLA